MILTHFWWETLPTSLFLTACSEARATLARWGSFCGTLAVSPRSPTSPPHSRQSKLLHAPATVPADAASLLAFPHIDVPSCTVWATLIGFKFPVFTRSAGDKTREESGSCRTHADFHLIKSTQHQNAPNGSIGLIVIFFLAQLESSVR